MKHNKQAIVLCILAGILLALASHAKGAVTCFVAYNNVETGVMMIQCPAYSTKGVEKGDYIRGKKVDPPKKEEPQTTERG